VLSGSFISRSSADLVLHRGSKFILGRLSATAVVSSPPRTASDRSNALMAPQLAARSVFATWVVTIVTEYRATCPASRGALNCSDAVRSFRTRGAAIDPRQTLAGALDLILQRRTWRTNHLPAMNALLTQN